MNALKKGVRDYIKMRRSLGYKLQMAPALLYDFASFLEERGALHITITLAVQWAQRNLKAPPAEWARRLTFVRGFARYWIATDPATEIPAWGLMPHRPHRARPYLYTEAEVRHLLQAARQMEGLPGLMYHCLFGLLPVTGLRISEALNLRPEDVDLDQGMLVIVGTKFGKSRWVPIHASTQKVLVQYVQQRDRVFRRKLPYFFVSRRGNRLDGGQVRRTFYRLSRQVGLRGQHASHGPRLHDFRHRFALSSLIGWYRSGREVESRLPILSTFLGHVHVADTYWYLTACPELMGLAVNRLEKRWEEPR
jgi:integrase/recombinase XerD